MNKKRTISSRNLKATKNRKKNPKYFYRENKSHLQNVWKRSQISYQYRKREGEIPSRSERKFIFNLEFSAQIIKLVINQINKSFFTPVKISKFISYIHFLRRQLLQNKEAKQGKRCGIYEIKV